MIQMGDVGLAPEARPWLLGLLATALVICVIVGWFARAEEEYDEDHP